jgi:hypothetical protein
MPEPALTQILGNLEKLSAKEQTAVLGELFALAQGKQLPTQMAMTDSRPLSTEPERPPGRTRICPICGWVLGRVDSFDPDEAGRIA